MSSTDHLAIVRNQLFDALEATQQLVLTSTAAMTSSVRSVTPVEVTWPLAGRMPDPVAATGAAFDVAARLLASQRAFAVKLAETCRPGTASSPASPAAARKPPRG